MPDQLADEAIEAIEADEAIEAIEAHEAVPVEQQVHDQVAALDGIEDAPLAEHAQRYDEVHAALQGALVEIDGESG